MTKNEIIEILVEEYGWFISDLKDKAHEELKSLLSIERRKERYNPFLGLDGPSDPDDGADMFPNGRDPEAEDEDSW